MAYDTALASTHRGQTPKLATANHPRGTMGKKRRRPAGTGAGPLRGDTLLVNRVHALLDGAEVGAEEDGAPKLTSERAYELLLQKHREYARKSEKGVRQLLSALIIERRQASSRPASPAGGDNESDDSDNDADGDTEDKHNMLNGGLYAAQRKKTRLEQAQQRQQAQEQDRQPVKAKSRKRAIPKSGQLPILPAGDGFGVQAQRPGVRFKDMGGIDSCIKDIRELCAYPLVHPELYEHLGVDPPRGVLLHGPPGSGKTMLARAIAGELDVAFYSISAPEIVSGMSGESEQKLRGLFDAARVNAPAIIFIDEIDAITGKRESSSRGMERRIVAQLLTCMDSLRREVEADDEDLDPNAVASETKEGRAADGTSSGAVLVIGATNRPDALDPALRRAGRFDREIAMGIPDTPARAKILQCLSSRMRLAGDFDFEEVARLTPGFVGADLDALCKEAAVLAVNRVFHSLGSDKTEIGSVDQMREPFSPDQLEPVFVQMSDFLEAVGKVQPSAKREGFATVPSVTWDDIGSLGDIREELSMAITEPIRHPERFRAMGLTAPMGVLLYGPPGCGKTLTAKAIANSSGSNFISVKGPELLNKYVGESERAVRQVFARARTSAPCVVFFDELDALCPRRGSDGSNGVSERVVNQLLTEMDGLEERREVFVIAATNRPDIIDPAILRPGRLDKLLYVPLPTSKDRVSILKTCARKTPMDGSVDLESVGCSPRLERFSGADLNALVKEAAMNALRRIRIEETQKKASEDADAGEAMMVDAGDAVQTSCQTRVNADDFEKAMNSIRPSISEKDQLLYRSMESAPLSNTLDATS
ncbi:26S proteasome regulatory subunit 8-like [Hondaea fermentalgiana]|uniref:26S proteasome regulatory subunit 8-like n=1 Tax=Hondaea fermentalgiana TaxID=2315210 RepID=A0A2R5GA24_9STRA|nr:26S proteasome regulatory subunit 8-like [Hondaea fermentalgiana]|eukprot:GBG27870.1 26S proteasome regulatory subunit 8-like [Hondaea fermentalgiana]